MASTLVAVSLCLGASGALVAQAGRPPIIDRELFFGNPEISSYTTAFRNFDVQKQKPTLKQLKVAATEQVTVPAGTFKAFKVEVSSADGEPGGATLWIDTDTRRLVKIEATLPQMGGAKLTSELTK